MELSISRQFASDRVVPTADPLAPRRSVRRVGLSVRLFLLTVAFVAIAEIMIFVPAVASYRTSWLTDRIAAAEIAALVLDATVDHPISSDLTQRLLTGVDAREVVVESGSRRRVLSLGLAATERADLVDLRGSGWLDGVAGSLRALAGTTPALIEVIGHGRDGSGTIRVVLDELPLRRDLAAFSSRLFLTSLAVACIAAVLIFVILQRLFVQPMRRLARNIADFADDPESADRVIAPSSRVDEIGDAEEALARMEIALAGELRHTRRLAGLGLSVSKISHELRNILTTAQLLGDRLEGVADPVVQRVAPRLVQTLDRANRFCEATLAYGRAAERHPQRRMVPLAPILDELVDLAALSHRVPVGIVVRSQNDLMADIDPEQLSRALANLVRNAVQALDMTSELFPTVTIEAARMGRRDNGVVTITVSDNGPGVPERAKPHLFAPFQGSMRAGGSGLGLAIASELAELNGGTLRLDPSERGARFVLTIPDRQTLAEAA
ncbi:sensor histidine kinase [Methylobacterium brachythecii]|uniref:histidine kinase n=1 Tax=Methylobacterium brachythecii TaxID=1176177 RepID=A0A7W6F6P1_9HYPH|nr:HAMP domain-containing sensor histidine kinase [Methylobacterium brachythecii]MBB3902569.1 signal transduction histidine kinase [Methylobacterium brachythecii]GLS42414.1 ATPase [Methylobacterium brachythecii]